MNDSTTLRRAAVALACGVGGVLLLTFFASAFQRPAPHVAAVLGVALTCCGLPYAIALMLAPRPSSLRIRHLAAGAAAAWLAGIVGIGATQLGLAADSDGFRVLWAPVSEEIGKALMLAALWSPWDDRKDRSALITAALGVGVGFAARENFVYFGSVLGQPGVSLWWVLLRSTTPVMAHAFFAMIMGGTMAHRAIQARVVGHPVPRLSVAGAIVAVVAHVSYNGVALIAVRAGGSQSLLLTELWAAVALVAAVLLRRRALALAAADEPIVTTHLPSLERAGALTAIAALALALTWMLPGRFGRTLAVGLTPMALAFALTAAVGTASRVQRLLVALVVGVALRPLVRVPEMMLDGVAMAVRSPHARVVLELMGNGAWMSIVAVITQRFVGARGSKVSLAFSVALASGLAAASLGGVLAIGSLQSRAPYRDLVAATLRVWPRTLAWSALLGLFGHRSLRAAFGVTLGAALGATLTDELLRLARPGWVALSISAGGYLLAVAALTWRVSRTDGSSVAMSSAMSVGLPATSPSVVPVHAVENDQLGGRAQPRP